MPHTRRYLAIEIVAARITTAKSRVQEFAYLGRGFESDEANASIRNIRKPVKNNSFVRNVRVYVMGFIALARRGPTRRMDEDGELY